MYEGICCYVSLLLRVLFTVLLLRRTLVLRIFISLLLLLLGRGSDRLLRLVGHRPAIDERLRTHQRHMPVGHTTPHTRTRHSALEEAGKTRGGTQLAVAGEDAAVCRVLAAARLELGDERALVQVVDEHRSGAVARAQELAILTDVEPTSRVQPAVRHTDGAHNLRRERERAVIAS